MAGNKWLSALDEMPGVAKLDTDPYAAGVRSPSPSVNFIFGNTHLIPWGASTIFWGPPKGGKSLICNLMIGQLHRDYPEAIAIKYNTELREAYQMTDKSFNLFGIDRNRYRGFDTNRPAEIFNVIEQDISALCEKGAPIKLIIIDSITDVMGTRMSNSDDVNQQQMGDDAATIQRGLKRIRTILRRHGITLLMVAQERAVLDPVEVMRGKKTKMAGAYYLQHFAEYFVYVAPNEAKEGKTNIMGEKFEDADMQDIMGNNEQVAHKIKVQMKDSSVGIAKRIGEFTFHKHQGIINIHEEAFRLGCARNVLERPNNRTYIFKRGTEELKWSSKEDCLMAIGADEDLQKQIIEKVRIEDYMMFKRGDKDQDFAAVEVE